ncbi:hypothetical protein [Profundibacterium mesophilum]|uniref:Major facilitator superfamily protein n=1 Tax=Profundibacterium mesophilum KAUST100406-0324 TaxID=1037889 RepID=A0A921NPS4_9RHOB|nr:hypothetical protein [Profundibacterium mesophilum]KAF0675712.1 major facilitator superfamily protein [Profundibacterium mesophilum KAUST100406-0324]
MFAPLRIIAGDPVLRLGAFSIILLGVFISSIGPYQSLIGIEVFGLSDGAYALVFVTGSSLSLLVSLAVGIITDRTARRRRAVVFAASAAMSGALVMLSLRSLPAFLLAHMLIFPLGSTLFGQIFTMTRLAASVHPEAARAGVQSAVRALFALPFLLVLPLWALAFAAGAPLLSVYAASAAAAAGILAIFLWRWPRDGTANWPDIASGLAPGKALGELAAPPVLARALLLAVVHGGIALYLVLTGLILSGVPGRDAGDVALFVALVAGCEMPVMLIAPRLLPRFGINGVILGAVCLYALFLLAFPLLAAGPFVWALIVPAACGAGVMLSMPILYIQDMMAARPGAGGALVSLVGLGGQVASAGVFALGSAIGGYGAASALGAMTVASAGALLFWIDRRARSGARAKA